MSSSAASAYFPFARDVIAAGRDDRRDGSPRSRFVAALPLRPGAFSSARARCLSRRLFLSFFARRRASSPPPFAPPFASSSASSEDVPEDDADASGSRVAAASVGIRSLARISALRFTRASRSSSYALRGAAAAFSRFFGAMTARRGAARTPRERREGRSPLDRARLASPPRAFEVANKRKRERRARQLATSRASEVFCCRRRRHSPFAPRTLVSR